MHYSITNIQANFGINRLIRYQVTGKKDIDTHGRRDVAYDNRYFFPKKNTKNKCM